MLETELGYIAGMFDGEGSITIGTYKQKGAMYYKLLFRIMNTNKECMDRIKEMVGHGTVCISHKREKVCWAFQLAGSSAEALMKEIRPLLIVKASRVDQALAFNWHGRVGEGDFFPPSRPEQYEKMVRNGTLHSR